MTAELVIVCATHCFSLVILVWATMRAAKQRRIFTFLFAGLAGYQLVTLPALVALSEEFGVAVLWRGELVIVAGCIALTLSIVLLDEITAPIGGDSDILNPVRNLGADWRYYSVIVTIFIIVSVGIAFRNGVAIAALSWEERRADASFIDSIANLLQFFMFPAAWVALRSRHKAQATCLFAVSILMFPVFGSRAALLTLPAVVVFDLLRTHSAPRSRWKLFVSVAGLGVLLHVLGRLARGFGLAGAIHLLNGDTGGIAGLPGLFGDVDWTGGEAEISRYFLFVIRDAPFADIDAMTSMTRWSTMYLPHFLAPGFKPEDVTYVLWRHAVSNGIFEDYASFSQLLSLLVEGDTGSIHPMLWGEAWVNGGWVGLPFFLLTLAAICVAIERLYEYTPAVVTTLAVPATAVGYLMVARGNSVVGLGYTFYLVPIAWMAHAAIRGTVSMIVSSPAAVARTSEKKGSLARLPPSVDGKSGRDI